MTTAAANIQLWRRMRRTTESGLSVAGSRALEAIRNSGLVTRRKRSRSDTKSIRDRGVSLSVRNLRENECLRAFQRMPHRVRVFLFVLGVTAFIGLSANRFSDFAWTEHKLDLVSQADNIAAPARQYLGAHLEHAAHIGCMSVNPDLSGVCDFIWYSLLPYYTKTLPPIRRPPDFPIFSTSRTHE